MRCECWGLGLGDLAEAAEAPRSGVAERRDECE